MFVAESEYYYTVGKYTTSGQAVSDYFITLSRAYGIAVSGSNLFVTTSSGGQLGKYSTLDGTGNPFFITSAYGASGIAVSGSTLYVVMNGGTTVATYDADTGATLNSAFITGFAGARGIAVSGSNLFVVDNSNHRVGEFNADTGATINASFITFSNLQYPSGIAVEGAAVPEPSTYAAMMGLASVGFVMIRRRLVRKQAA